MSVRVDAVVYFRVVDPVKAAVNVQDYQFAISQLAQTSLRSVIGKAELDDLLSNREKLGAELTEIIDDTLRAAVGCQGRAGRGQGRDPAGVDEAVDVPAGRGRT